MFQELSNPPDELAQNVSKKNPRRTNYSPFFLRKCRIWPFFNYLHDSNSIFWAQGIKSEGFFGRTVRVSVYLINFSGVVRPSTRASSFAPRRSCSIPTSTWCTSQGGVTDKLQPLDFDSEQGYSSPACAQHSPVPWRACCWMSCGRVKRPKHT